MLHCSVAEAKERVSLSEFLAWQVYYQVTPYGDDWERSAMIAQQVESSGLTICRGMPLNVGKWVKKKHFHALKSWIPEIRPLSNPPEPTQTPDAMWAALMHFTEGVAESRPHMAKVVKHE